MTPDETHVPDPAPADTDVEGPAAPLAGHAARRIESDALQANMSAIASANVGSLEAVGSAIAFASVAGDAAITASATPLVNAKGDVTIRQSYTSAVLAGGDMTITQAAAPIIVGKQLSISQGGGVVLAAGEASVERGFVGVLLTPKATISDDSKVLLSTKAALIIAAALFGGFALVAVVMVLGVKRVMTWRPQVNVPALPDLGALAQRWRRHDA